MDLQLSELLDLRNRTAIVTGAARGIGAAIATRFSQAGACVAIADVETEAAHRIAGGICGAGGIARAFQCDVSKLSDIRSAVAQTVESFGGLDILVNNAGVFPLTPALEMSESTWDRVLSINLKGAFFFAQCAAARMASQGSGGSIVNIASIDRLHPTGHLCHYDASKGGLLMLTRSLALELAPKRIRVNAIAPGAIQTPGAHVAMSSMGASGATQVKHAFVSRIPLGRMGEPDDIARAALFLASRASDYMTGATIVVDGGFLLA